MKNMEPTPENIAQAKKFLLAVWRERANEFEAEAIKRGRPPRPESMAPVPLNLSGACKFVSLFAVAVFGGKLKAHYNHCWVLREGEVLDLTDGVDGTLYCADRQFMRRGEFRRSLDSCRPRVEEWVRRFLELTQDP